MIEAALGRKARYKLVIVFKCCFKKKKLTGSIVESHVVVTKEYMIFNKTLLRESPPSCLHLSLYVSSPFP